MQAGFLDLVMTDTGPGFQPLAVKNSQLSPTITDQAGLLEPPRNLGDADTPHAHNPGELLVSDIVLFAAGNVLQAQEQRTEVLFQGVIAAAADHLESSQEQ